jgi:hypothetical protein
VRVWGLRGLEGGNVTSSTNDVNDRYKIYDSKMTKVYMYMYAHNASFIYVKCPWYCPVIGHNDRVILFVIKYRDSNRDEGRVRFISSHTLQTIAVIR